MADTFTPRGAPVPANSYDGWELTHRPAMLPFLAEYTNQQGETAGGWAMPNMVTEPVNALFRLMNTPTGTMPDPRDSQNQSDALTGLMALYGGNALGGVARNAMSRGVARGLNMEAARPVAYSNAIDEAMSNPNMLSMMRDIDYANLNRRALDEYGVGYEGLTSSQEAQLRGWSDPATLMSDTGRPNPVGAAVAGKPETIRAYHGGPGSNPYMDNGAGYIDKFRPGENGAVFSTDNPTLAGDYAAARYPDRQAVYPLDINFKNPYVVDRSAGFRTHKDIFDAARAGGHDGVIFKNSEDSVTGFPNRGLTTQYAAIEPGTITSPYTKELLFSDTGKPSLLGAALAGYDPNWPFNK